MPVSSMFSENYNCYGGKDLFQSEIQYLFFKKVKYLAQVQVETRMTPKLVVSHLCEWPEEFC